MRRARIVGLPKPEAIRGHRWTAGFTAMEKALERAGLALSDMDRIEFMEAFAVTIAKFLRDYPVDPEQVNVSAGTSPRATRWALPARSSPRPCSTFSTRHRALRTGRQHRRTGRGRGHGGGAPRVSRADLRKLRLPVMAAPMFLVSGPDMVIAAARSGIAGAFPTPNCRTAQELDRWMEQIAQETADAPGTWAANLVTHSSNARLADDLALVAKHKPPIVITALGSPARRSTSSTITAASFSPMWWTKGSAAKPLLPARTAWWPWPAGPVVIPARSRPSPLYPRYGSSSTG